MISWTEQEPDFRCQPVEAICARLDFIAATSLWSRSRDRFLILIDRQVREQIEEHLKARQIEQGGLLMGNVYGNAGNQTIVAIEDAVPASDALGTGVSLTMTSQVWEDARARLSGERVVVGWYHSHPNLGAFFSGTDRQTQRAFFGNRHSVGLVSDPIRREERWFSGADSMEIPPEDRLVLALGS